MDKDIERYAKDENNLEAALELLKKKIELGSKNPRDRFLMAAIYLNTERYEEGLPYAEEAVRAENADFDAYTVKAGILMELKRFEEVLDVIEQIPFKDYESELSKQRFKIMVLPQLKRYDEAINICDILLKENSDPEFQEQLKSNKILIYLTMENYTKAEIVADEVLALNPKCSFAWHSKAVCSIMEVETYEEAVSYLKTAWDVDNNNTKALIDLTGALMLELKKYEEGEPYLRILEKIIPEGGDTYLLKALLEKHNSNPKEAITLLEKATHLKTSQKSDVVYAILSQTYFEAGRNLDAEETLRNALEIFPKSERLEEELATLYTNEKRYYEAMIHILRGVQGTEFYPKSVKRFRGMLRTVFEKIGSPDSIISELKDLIKISDSSVQTEELGFLLVSMLDYTKRTEDLAEISRKLFRELQKEGKLEQLLSPIGADSSTPVYILSANALSENLYIIKTVDRTKNLQDEIRRLQYEHDVTSYLSTITDKVPQMLALEPGYLLEKRIKRPTIKETEKDQDEELKKAIETLALIHVEGTANLTIELRQQIRRHNYTEELERRLIRRLGINSAGKELIQAHKEIITSPFSVLRHGDVYPGNVLEEGYLVDLERVCLGDMFQDITQLLSHPYCKDSDKVWLLEEYIDLVEKDIPNANRKLFERQYELMTAHDALCRIGKKLSVNKTEEAQHYLEILMEQRNINLLQQKTVNYLKSLKLLS